MRKNIFISKEYVKKIILCATVIFVVSMTFGIQNDLYASGFYRKIIKEIPFGNADGQIIGIKYSTWIQNKLSFCIKNNYIYILDTGNKRIQKFDMEGNFMSSFIPPDINYFDEINAFSVDADENYYVFEIRKGEVTKYDKNGVKQFTIGTKGSGLNKFGNISKIEINSIGDIYLYDLYVPKIEKFDKNGNFVYGFSNINEGFTLDSYDNMWCISKNRPLPHIGTRKIKSPPMIEKYDKYDNLVKSFPFYIEKGNAFIKSIDSKGNLVIEFAYEEYDSQIKKSVKKIESYMYRIENNFANRKGEFKVGDDIDMYIDGKFIRGEKTGLSIYVLRTLSDDKLIGWKLYNGVHKYGGYNLMTGYIIFEISKIENTYPSWSPESTRILYESNAGGRWGISGMELAGTSKVAGETEVSTRAGCWHPSGRIVGYVSKRGDTGSYDLYMRNIFTNEETAVLQTKNADETSPCFSPRGDKMLYGSNESGKWHVYEIEIATKKIRQLTSGDSDEVQGKYSPDGKSIVYASSVSGNWDIYIKQIEDGSIRQLTNSNADEIYPCWNPNGRKVAYCSNDSYTGRPGIPNNPDGEWKIYLKNADGSGEVIQITEEEGNHRMPDWSGNGRKIAYVSDEKYFEEIFVKNADGTGEPLQVTGGE